MENKKPLKIYIVATGEGIAKAFLSLEGAKNYTKKRCVLDELEFIENIDKVSSNEITILELTVEEEEPKYITLDDINLEKLES